MLFALIACGTVSCGDKNPANVEKGVPNMFQGEELHYGNNPDALVRTIDDPGLPSVLVTRTDGRINIGVYQAGTGAPAVTISDLNDDGIFDLLTYSALYESGKVRAVVEDYGMDGQPDLILNIAEQTGAVFYDGKWREVDGVSSPNVTVKVDGANLALSEIIRELRGDED